MPKNTYEGCYATQKHLVVCFKQETGGVPRFENVVITWKEFRTQEARDLALALRKVLECQEGPPWVDEPLPGIG